MLACISAAFTFARRLPVSPLLLAILPALLCGCARSGRNARRGPGLDLDAYLATRNFTLAAEPRQPVTVQAYVGGMGPGRAAGQDFLMLTLSAPRRNRLKQPPRYWAIGLDTSAGMRGRSWRLALKAARALIEHLRDRDRVAIVVLGRRQRILAAWVSPDQARDALEGLRPGFEPAPACQATGLSFLATGLLVTAKERKVKPVGFLVSNLAGAGPGLVSTARGVTASGLRMHVLCVAGGSDELLPALRRELCGKALFLAQPLQFAHDLVEFRYRYFDTAATDVRVTLWLNDRTRVAPAMDAFPGLGECPGASAPTTTSGQGRVISLSPVRHLGPGESRVWLLRLACWEAGVVPRLRVRARGRDEQGREFLVEGVCAREYLRFLGRASRGSGPEKAIYKAITAARCLAGIRRLQARGLYHPRARFSRVMREIKGLQQRLGLLNLRLSDADLVEENRMMQQICTLTPAEFERVLRGNRSHALRASALPERMQARGFSFLVLENLLLRPPARF